LLFAIEFFLLIVKCFEDFERTQPSPEEIQAFYDLWGPDYDDDMKYAQYYNPYTVIKEVEKLFPDNKNINILDVGAGTGEIGKLLNKAGYTAIDGADSSRTMLDQAEQLKVYQNLYHEMLEENKKFRDGCKDGYYDLVVSAGSFYPFHLSGNHLHSIINCVKPNGYFIISSAPSDDEGVDMTSTLKRLQNEGMISVVEEVYVPKWFRNSDGIVWILKKL
jgi:predicted TPR repeat methyltransferase